MHTARRRRIPRLRPNHPSPDPEVLHLGKKSKINVAVQIGFRQAKTSPTITQDQRLAWLKDLLTGDSESLPYRVAGVLLLLCAQSLTKIAALQSTAYNDHE